MKTFLSAPSVALLAVVIVACGDDSSSTGGGGGGGTSTTTAGPTTTSTSGATSTSSGPATSSSSGTTSATSGSGGSGGEGGAGSVTVTTGQGGGAVTTTGNGGAGQGGGAGGDPNEPPCADACSGDAGCDEDPPSPGQTCASCVQAEAAAQSQCALEGAFSDACQSDPDCSDYITCVLGGSLNCDQTNPEGAQLAAQAVLFTCGACGDFGGGTGGNGAGGAGGGGQGGSGPDPVPCGDDCENDAGCDQVPIDPGATCALCVQAAADAQETCALEAAFSDDCQNDVDCSDYINCLLGGGSECETDFPDGYANAVILTFFLCGDCGDGQI